MFGRPGQSPIAMESESAAQGTASVTQSTLSNVEHAPMSLLHRLTWERLIEAEQIQPAQATSDSALGFFTRAGFEAPYQVAGLQIDDLVEGEIGVHWPGGATTDFCTRMFYRVQAVYRREVRRRNNLPEETRRN